MNQFSSEEIGFQEKVLRLIRKILSPDEKEAKSARNELCKLLLPEACQLAERWLGPQVGRLKAWLRQESDHLGPLGSEVLSAIHDGLLKATDPRNLLTYNHRRPYRPWAMTVVRNSVLNALKRETRRGRRQVPLNQDLMSEGTIDPVEMVMRQERIERARLVFEEMPNDTVRILMMKQAGFTFREMGDELGIHEDNVESRYYRGKRDFERRFREQSEQLGSRMQEGGGEYDASRQSV